MLLKLKNNAMHTFRQVCCFSVALLASQTLANELQINGFIAQGIVQNKDSSFINDDDDISFDLTEVGINASYQFTPNFRLAGQAVYLNAGNRFDEGARLDYLLLDWNFYSDEQSQSNFYIGKIKNYHWLYSSTRDVPMTRPSIVLPQSVYFDGTRDMSVGGEGAAFSHKYSSINLGEIDFTISTSKSDVPDEDLKNILAKDAKGRLSFQSDLQASIYWQPSASAWRFGFATTNADFSYEQGEDDIFFDGELKLKRYYLNAEYFGETWSFSAELLQENLKQKGLLFPLFYRDTTGRGGFIQSEYQLSDKALFLFRYERYFANKDDKSGNKLEESSFGLIPAYFGFQHDNTLGFSYQFDDNLKVQLEHHWVEGTARLTPFIIPDPIANPKEHWQFSAIQLTHWF